MATTAPRPGQAGYIADPFAKQIAQGTRAPVTVHDPDAWKAISESQDYWDLINASNDAERGLGPPASKVEDITNLPGMGGPYSQQGNNDAQQAFMAQRGIQGGLDEATMKATERLLGNAGMHFGQGGGDWAKAWTKQMSPLQSNFMKMYGGIDTDLFNSASGPYGQMQQAAAYTAPARNDRQAREYEADTSRYIADRKYDTASQLFSQLQQAINKPNIAGVETDYGAFAKVMPTLMAKYMPKR